MAPVSPVTACLLAVYAAATGRGTCADSDPLRRVRPPCGDGARRTRNVSRLYRNTPGKFTRRLDRLVDNAGAFGAPREPGRTG